MLRLSAFSFVLALGACTTTSSMPTDPASADEITYATSRCFGTCPVYSVTVGDPGRPGVFVGEAFTAVEGKRDFAISAKQRQAFRKALATARAADPAAYLPGGAHCQMRATDHSSITVTFREGEAEPREFHFYTGCRDPENAALAKSLREAPRALPIAGFIGKD